MDDPVVEENVTPRRRVWPLPKQSQVFFFLILAVMLYLTWQVFRDFIIYMITGAFVAVLALPIDKFWERFFPNRVSAVCTMLSLFLIITVPLVLLGFGMYNDASKMVTSVQNGEAFQLIEDAMHRPLGQKILGIAYPDLNETQRIMQVHTQLENGRHYIEDQLNQFLNALAGSAPDFLVGLAVILFMVYYVLTDGERFIAYFRRAAPLPGRQIDFLLHEARNGLNAVFMGQILTALIQGALGGLAFFALGIPNAILWAAVMAILSLLPVLGAFLVWVPAAIWLFVDDHPVKSMLMLAWGILVVSQVDNFVRPKLIGNRADIHPLFVLVGVLGGVAAFGFIGLFLGPLLVGVTIAVLKVYEQDYLDPEINLLDEYEGGPDSVPHPPTGAPPANEGEA